MSEGKTTRTDDESTLAAMVRELDAKLADALAAKERAEVEQKTSEAFKDFLLLKADRFNDGIDWIQSAMQAEAERDALAAKLADAERMFDFHAHLQNQREWSERTFGPGERSAGVVDHIRKELREIEEAPLDLEEWIDVVILALDGAWRAGHSPDAIITQLVAKQAKNESRQWPDWRTAEPGKAIEHVKLDAAVDAALAEKEPRDA